MGVKKKWGYKKNHKKKVGVKMKVGVKKKWGGNVRKEISLTSAQFVDVTGNMALEVNFMTLFLEVVGLNLAIFKF